MNWQNSELFSLNKEYKYYRMMGDADGFPKCYYFGKCGDNNALVMELLGLNLDDLLTICDGRFSAKTVSKIAIQAITRVESLHSCGLIHRCSFVCSLFLSRIAFLVATKRLYMRVCPSVGRMDGWSVGWSVTSYFFGLLGATNAVYTALFLQY